MLEFIELHRKFRKLTSNELEDPDYLAHLNESEWGFGFGWGDLLKYSRVILLAEAGAGKTVELHERQKRLFAEGKNAFFLPMESLANSPLTELLSVSEERAFEGWKSEGHKPAWFFLDAVDELKITGDKFERALFRLSKELDGHLSRVKIVVSCRAHDWYSSVDSRTFTDLLPIPNHREETLVHEADKLFVDVLRSDSVREKNKEDESAKFQELQTVVLLPLSDKQIQKFVTQSGCPDADGFIGEMERRNAWSFARRPLDLVDLLISWRSNGRLGTRAEQSETSVTLKLKERSERRDRGVLSDDKARSGAERLALALALTRTRTMRSPDSDGISSKVEGVLDPAAILPDWTEVERQALLRRGLFIPATSGRVRFCHRSTQEFLAARRLSVLRNKGMSIASLLRLLFAQRYGEDVVLPSMRPIAGWLALWHTDVRRELIRREPETLLSHGDPESLDIQARTDLLKAFAVAYDEGGWRGLDIPIDEVRRLASPDLAPIVRDLWGDGPSNEDVRGLLLEMMWKGALAECADLAYGAAQNISLRPYHRIIAVKALVDGGRDDFARKVALDVLAKPYNWPPRVVAGIASDLFPICLTVWQLCYLLERTPEPVSSVSGFEWGLRQIAKTIDIKTSEANSLQKQIAHLIWKGRNSKPGRYSISSKYEHLTPGLARLCVRQLEVKSCQVDEHLIRSCIIAISFASDVHGNSDEVKRLRAILQDGSISRADIYWIYSDFMDALIKETDDRLRFYNTLHECPCGIIMEEDKPWLEKALVDSNNPKRRVVALYALLDLWSVRGRIKSELATLRTSIQDDTSLIAIVDHWATPPEPDEKYERMMRESRQRERENEVNEQKRLRGWKEWRKGILSDLESAFAPQKIVNTIANLHYWLKRYHGGYDRFTVWSRDVVCDLFNSEFADRMEEELKRFWRIHVPALWSVRPEGERNGVKYWWIYGLSGLAVETASPGWAGDLSSEEARIATVYSTIELNGFASFITELSEAHPKIVEEVIGEELDAQMSLGGERGDISMLQDLCYTSMNLKQLLAPRLLKALLAWPSTFTEETGSRLSNHLEKVLQILKETSSAEVCQEIAKECVKRYESDPYGLLALVWLRGLFRLDAVKGVSALTKSLSSKDDIVIRDKALKYFAGLFNDRKTIVLEIADPSQRAKALGQLVRFAYSFIRREDDQYHEGVYSPNLRDDAQSARDYLLSALFNTPGPEARNVMLELAEEQDFSHFPDRIRYLARQRAAVDAEFEPFPSDKLIELEKRFEVPPEDRDGLFGIVMDRLQDLAHRLAHGDDSDRRTLREIAKESEMQRTLSWRLSDMAKGAYTLTREEEVADGKEPDMRFIAKRGGQKVAVELKLADKRWSLTDLERALQAQLAGQYLRHDKCKAGILLLIYNGEKQYWINSVAKKRLLFTDMISYLNEKAASIEEKSGYGIRLAAFGIDLTDPDLEPAHRN